MALAPQFLDELRARTPMAALVGRKVKLRKAGRDWTGCCPFHTEKTPSFYVYADHFHCFGCGAHGDAISFVMQTTGAGFPDAVEALAAEAGLDVPKASPAQARAEQQLLDLHEVLQRAQDAFVRLLHAPEGAPALAYLRQRGLKDATIAGFGLGWSGDGRGGVLAALREAGIEPARALEAGLLRQTEDGSLRELYWGRVTFPIHDRRGRLISFGGRALGDAKPKYINGPDSPVFGKRRTLYGLHRAREAVRGPQPLLVVEGYMDVIALHQAGFTAAVAPLGTALTDDHLAELWRLAPAPVLCFDGDAAGARAAERAIALAMTLLRPGATLDIVTLPAGEDPDSLLRQGGKAALDAAVASAQPLADALFASLAQGVGTAPEQRAALRTRLDAAAAAIPDRTLAAEFRNALRTKFFEQFRRKFAARAAPAGRRDRTPMPVAPEQARLLTAILLRHPEILRDVEEAYQSLDLPPDLMRLREHILALDADHQLDSPNLLAHLHRSGMAEQADAVLSAARPTAASVRPGAMPAEAEAEWWHIYGLMRRQRLEDELVSARHAFASAPDPASQRRLVALRSALAALTEPEEDENRI